MSMNLNISAKKDSETHFDKKGKPHKETYAKSSGFTVEVLRKITRGWMNQ